MIKIKVADISILLVSLFYAWYVMPAVNAYFTGGLFNILFFSCYALGFAGLALTKRKHLGITKMVLIAVVYCAAILIMTIMGIADAEKHVRIGLVFVTTVFLYFMVLNKGERVKIGKILLCFFLLTCLTSSIGVLVDNRVARTLTHAAADDVLQHSLSLLNIADIYLFQCMVMIIPALCAALENRKKLRALLVVCIGVILLNASFSISLVMYVLAVFLVFYERYATSFSKKTVMFFFFSIFMVMLYLMGYDLLTVLSEVITNDYISIRILNIRDLLYGHTMTGGTLEARLEVYSISWTTFIENLFGVGPYYAYTGTAEGIGYHSQILDDLARYGIFAIVMYIAFFREYFRCLKHEWKKIGQPWVASATTTLYGLFLMLNIGMRSGIESVVMLFIIPVIPEIILSEKKRRSGKTLHRQTAGKLLQ